MATVTARQHQWRTENLATVPMSPERLLVAGMLDRTVRDLTESNINPATKAEAKAWVLGSGPQDHPFRFDRCCQHLGLDPDATRERLLELSVASVLTTRGKV